MWWRAPAAILVFPAIASPIHLTAQDYLPAKTTLDSVFTASQADKGKQVYQKNCTACHAPAAYTGLAFRRAWSGRSVYDFFDLVRTTMPDDNPGKLSRDEYAEIMAYLLKLNGLPAGENELPSDDEPLKQIKIVVQPPSPP
jgi:mono/diheme cytochrome c family protein